MSTAELATPGVQSTANAIVQLAADGLEQMLDREQQLFCFTMRMGPRVLVRQGVSPRYTMMTLLGLNQWEKSGQTSPVPISPILNRLLGNTSWINCLGDLGLLLWTCAVLDPDRLTELVESTRTRDALDHYHDGITRRTMELAWFLTGLCYSLQTKPCVLSDLHIQADRTFRLLAANQGRTGVFGHLARNISLAGMLRGPIGSFADQVYPIYALTQFGRVTGNQEALERASDCATAICNLQGPKGEWWWHYDAGSGNVVETYPVYSVHQDGMAPMALFVLGEVTGRDFSQHIRRGLAWIAGHNELAYDMRSEASRVIWRNLQLRRSEQYLRRLLPSRAQNGTSATQIQVNHECRPYELGWALYALAGREALLD